MSTRSRLIAITEYRHLVSVAICTVMSLGSELSWKYAVLSELLVEPVVHMHPEPVEDVHMEGE